MRVESNNGNGVNVQYSRASSHRKQKILNPFFSSLTDALFFWFFILSRRLEKTENGDTISYLYDGGVSVQEYDAEGSLKTFLVRAGGYGGGIGDVVYTENGSSGEREYFLYNAIGSTSALTDDSGSVISTTNYGAWGTETGTTGSCENVRKFSTKERSASIGLDYFGFRYYDYDLGRFTTRDPSGYPDA